MSRLPDDVRRVVWAILGIAVVGGCAEGRIERLGAPVAVADGAPDAAPPVDAAWAVDSSNDGRDLGGPIDAAVVEDAAVDAAPDGAVDARVDDTGVPVGDAAGPEGPAIYVAGRDHSPLTPAVVARLRRLRDAHPEMADDVFAKVGASATVSRSFLHCFGGDPARIDLDGRDGLWATIDHFRAGDAGGVDPFRRESEAAVVGWSARSVLAGAPSALDREIDALAPRFAVVMYGTNDIQRRDIDGYAGDMLTLVDRLLARGVIPILTSIMPRDDDPEADRLVPSYNAVVRGVAEARQVPFVDFHRNLVPLPDHGLSSDRLHPSTYRPGGAPRPCVFTPDGLRHGYNIRNLLTIQALDRLARVLLDDEPAPDPPARPRPGRGAPDDPFVVDRLPFADLRDTRASPHRSLEAYPSCDAGQDESGPEYVYRFDVARTTTIRAWVLDRGDVDVDLHLLADPDDPETCLDRDHHGLIADLAPGTWYFVVDTFVPRDGEPRAGEYLFVVVEERAP